MPKSKPKAKQKRMTKEKPKKRKAQPDFAQTALSVAERAAGGPIKGGIRFR
jgi:hypothetical protein